jgi:hypothetical protein
VAARSLLEAVSGRGRVLATEQVTDQGPDLDQAEARDRSFPTNESSPPTRDRTPPLVSREKSATAEGPLPGLASSFAAHLAYPPALRGLMQRK